MSVVLQVLLTCINRLINILLELTWNNTHEWILPKLLQWTVYHLLILQTIGLLEVKDWSWDFKSVSLETCCEFVKKLLRVFSNSVRPFLTNHFFGTLRLKYLLLQLESTDFAGTSKVHRTACNYAGKCYFNFHYR